MRNTQIFRYKIDLSDLTDDKIVFLGIKTHFFHQWHLLLSFWIDLLRDLIPPLKKNIPLRKKMSVRPTKTPQKCTFLQNRSKTDLLLAIFYQGKSLGVSRTTWWWWTHIRASRLNIEYPQQCLKESSEVCMNLVQELRLSSVEKVNGHFVIWQRLSKLLATPSVVKSFMLLNNIVELSWAGSVHKIVSVSV